MVLLASISEEKEQNRENFRQKQLDFIHRCKRSELSTSTYVSDPTERCIGGRRANILELWRFCGI